MMTFLDVGGWFKPHPDATHVIDIMPWETRRKELSLTSLSDEKFAKSTWYQADFLASGFRMPFADKQFDFVYCGHTVEDLSDPSSLIKEMSRIGKSGLIVSPSRLHEQTIGVRDRRSNRMGHPHHHWICEAGQKLELYSKEDSRLKERSSHIPLLEYEKITGSDERLSETHYHWSDEIEYTLYRGSVCADRASDFKKNLRFPYTRELRDRFLRLARRYKYRNDENEHEWWPLIVEQSKQYSSIDLSKLI